MIHGKLKKSTYMQGAVVATLGIVLSKILGIIYVIPFHAIIGEQGGALYGYAYNIYSIFLGISTAGIPLAISKIISEYDTLGYFKSKEKAFKIAKRILSVLGIICFLILFIFAKEIAVWIIGDITGGNSIEDIAFVIRVIATSVLVVPILSVYRGYLQGHTYMTPTSVSQVLEQIVRVSIIIVGSYLVLKVFHLPLKYGVAVALAGATIGSIVSYLYLKHQVKINKSDLVKESTEEKVISTKTIGMAILLYAFPFIFGDVCKSLYNSVDTFFVVKTLVNDLGYSVSSAESIMSVISTWGNKLNMIIIAIGTGFMVSLIPNLTRSLVKNDRRDIRNKITKTLQILIFVTLPMTVGLSFLAEPVWNAFYGASEYGASVFCLSIYTAFLTVLSTMCTTTLLTLKEHKVLFTSLLTGLIVNAICDVPFMHLCARIGWPAYYGATISTIFGNSVSVLIAFIFLHGKYEVSFKTTIRRAIKTVIAVLIMVGVLTLCTYLVPLGGHSRVVSIFVILFYALIGGGVYFLVANIMGMFRGLFGKNIKEIVQEFYQKVRRKIS